LAKVHLTRMEEVYNSLDVMELGDGSHE